MTRWISLGTGFVFVFVLLVAFFAPRETSEPDPIKALHLKPRNVQWQHDGPGGLGVLGTFDRAQLQRGYQVYTEACAACHGLRYVAFRNLADLGFSDAEVRAIARQRQIADIDPNTGEEITRPGVPADRFPSPYPNEIAARAANNNAYPVDLSLITIARKGGQRYIYSLLVGYQPPPPGFQVTPGLHFNPYFESVQIAMPPPLMPGRVDYADGTEASVEQMAADVTAFLRWAAEPELEARRRTGLATIGFLLILSVLAWFTYRRVWADVQK
jgi:ubiquinol-cytochrome c reductase cytochrome c1 subunit